MSLKKYIVGGWVRDKLLSELGHPMQSNDKDWVVTGATPEEMLKLKFVPVGSDFAGVSASEDTRRICPCED